MRPTLAPHPSDMRAWPEIGCQRGHLGHESLSVSVDLAKPHGYHDYPQVPKDLARAFGMQVFDWKRYEDGPYCPGHDVISETIATLGIWEPVETTLVLQVCSSRPGPVVDLGAQIGWFSLLAASCGCPVTAVDADDEPLLLLAESAEANGWGDLITCQHRRLGVTTEPEPEPPSDQPIRLLKLDMEGGEEFGIGAYRPALEAGLVEHILMEVSPVFADYYPDLLADLIAMGFLPYLLPDKSLPPAVLEDPERDLQHFKDPTIVAGWHQANVWLRHWSGEW